MALFNRSPRPLNRETQEFRDDRLFIVACDDTYAPSQFFEFLKFNRVQVHVIPTIDGTSHAQYVLERVLQYQCQDYDERWILLDTDHCIESSHIKSYITAIRNAERAGVKVAISRSCFEVWLLLHHIDPSGLTHLRNAEDTEILLKNTLGSYDKKMLKEDDYPLNLVAQAILRAEKLDHDTLGTHIPKGVCTRVYKLLQAIIDGSSVQQLPKELQALKRKNK